MISKNFLGYQHFSIDSRYRDCKQNSLQIQNRFSPFIINSFMNLEALLGVLTSLSSRAHYEFDLERSNIIINPFSGLVGCLISDEVRQLQKNRQSVIKMRESKGHLGPNPDNNSPFTSPTSSKRELKAIKSTLFKNVDKAVNNEVTSTKSVSKRTSQDRQIEEELQESRQKRQKEDSLLSRAVRLEMQIGREPDLLDIMWYLNLNYEEIESIWDQLKFVYPNFDREYLTSVKKVPEMESKMVVAA